MDGETKTMTPEIELEEVEIEAYALRGEAVPQAKRYRIRIDKTQYVVENPTPTGAELLAFAGKTPDKWLIYQIIRGRHPEPVDANERVDLRGPGVERFTTVQRDPTDGLVQSVRREFVLPTGDHSFLESLGYRWEAVKDGQTLVVIIHDWPLPSGYNVKSATLALKLPASFPDDQIDMVYFAPSISRVDGVGIPNLTAETICGELFQQWSRHRTPENPWRTGVDDISTHLCLVDDWLRREFRLR